MQEHVAEIVAAYLKRNQVAATELPKTVLPVTRLRLLDCPRTQFVCFWGARTARHLSLQSSD